MNDLTLEGLLGRRRAAPLPRLPASFQEDVWRAIRQRRANLAESRYAWVAWLVEPLFRPAMLFSALSLAAILGIGLGILLIDHRAMQTRLALDLQIFGKAPPSVRTTLIGYPE